jgi:hypothetical protein
MSLSFWIISIIDASVLRSSYKDKPIGVRAEWLASSVRSVWISLAIPKPETWIGVRVKSQSEGAVLFMSATSVLIRRC